MKSLFAFARNRFTADLGVHLAPVAIQISHLPKPFTLTVAALLLIVLAFGEVPSVAKMNFAPPPAPTLTSPGSSAAPGQSISTITPTFQWQAASGAVSYGLYISKKNASGAYDLVFDSEMRIGTLTGTSLPLPSGVLADGGEYRWNMRAQNSAGWGSFSVRFYFTVRLTPSCTPPSIVTQPTGKAIAPGQTVTLSVAASGTAPLKYQWYKGARGDIANPIPNATSSSFTTPALSNDMSYWVRVSSACGSVDSVTVAIPVLPLADVGVTMSALPNPVVTGSTITYKITVKNNGPTTATTVSLTDSILTNATFQSNTAPGGWSCINPAVGSVGTITCAKASMASAETATFTVVVKVNPSTPDKTVISNTATISSLTVDTNGSNNSATVKTTVSANVDLALTMTASPSSVDAGANITYSITVKNNGPAAASNVMVTDNLPASAIFFSCSATGGGVCGNTGNNLTVTFASLPNAASAVITLVTRTNPFAADGLIVSNTATVANSSSPDPNPGNNTALTKTTVTTAISCPSDSITRLVADENDNAPIGNRTPLILIHGIHGNDDISTLDRAYFGNLLRYFDNARFETKYKIYRFHYESDQCYVSDIARSLRNSLDRLIRRDANFDKPFVIIAHSMGGLVARSYMNQYAHKTGIYAGQPGGERVTKLITLATPHHGVPGANEQSRNDIAANAEWRKILDIASLFYWLKGLGDVIVPSVQYFNPNRSDLLWDNFDNRFNAGNPDLNLRLKLLNRFESYGGKIIAYYGYIKLDDHMRESLIRSNAVSDFDPGNLKFIAALAKLIGDVDTLLISSNITIDYGLNHIYRLNDGLVPLESAAFNGVIINKRVECPGFNHAEMKQNEARLCANGLSLFASISNDLDAIALGQ